MVTVVLVEAREVVVFFAKFVLKVIDHGYVAFVHWQCAGHCTGPSMKTAFFIFQATLCKCC